MDKPLVSIIILTWKHAAYIEGCLRTVFEQTYPNIEVIVCDNASDDDIADRIGQLPWAERVKFISSDRNRGCAGGNNFAARHAKGAVLLFLNPDTQLDSKCVTELARPLLADKHIGITGAKIYYPNSRVFQHAGGIINKNGMCAHRGEGEEDAGQYNDIDDVDYVTGAALAIRRDLFLYLGGYDEDYNPAYYEESDLCWRTRKKNYRVVYIPSAVLWHEEGAALTKWSPRFYWLNYRNRVRFLIKNYSAWKWLTQWLPQEIEWFRYREAKGYRLLQLKAYAAGVGFAFSKLFNLITGKSRNKR